VSALTDALRESSLCVHRRTTDEVLKSSHIFVRFHIAEALGQIGPNAVGAVPALADALKDPDEDVRFHAAEALGKIGPNAAGAVPALADALNKDRAIAVRQSAAYALGKIGPDAAAAVPALVAIVNNPSEIAFVRQRAAKALARILQPAA
jgi:HEAT repeat protein